MKVPYKKEIPHKLAMYKLLQVLLANAYVANHIYFKGGTCAAMLGYLDRFSIDLDFDLIDQSSKNTLRQNIHQLIKKINYQIKDESRHHLQFFLKYREGAGKRNTLKLEIGDLVSKENIYEKVYLPEIDQYCQAQTVETMFANKLIALKARFEEKKGIAGRDMYDIAHFLKSGYTINQKVITDIRQTPFRSYLKEVIDFVQKNVFAKILWEDLNPLLPKQKLRTTVPYLKQEVLAGLKEYV